MRGVVFVRENAWPRTERVRRSIQFDGKNPVQTLLPPSALMARTLDVGQKFEIGDGNVESGAKTKVQISFETGKLKTVSMCGICLNLPGNFIWFYHNI